MRTYPLVFFFALGGACTVDVGVIPCEIDNNCDLAGGGTCELYSPSGETWCQYPDANCPSGRRWSDYGTFGDISGQCVGDAPLIDAGTDAPRPDADPGAEFAIRWGGAETDVSQALAVDSRGDVFVVGSFFATVNFGGQSLTSAGGSDLYVAKYSSTGGLVWVKGFGGAQSDSAWAVTVDGNDDVVVTGYSGVSATDLYVFVAKVAGTDGATLWQRTFAGTGTSFFTSGTGVAADASGDVLLAGNFMGSLNLGGIPLTSNGGNDVFVARLRGSDGTPEQARRFGSAGTENATALGVDAAGALWLSGFFVDTTVDFGGGPLTASGTDTFLLKLDAAGNHLWSRSVTASGTSNAIGELRMAPGGGIVVGGYFGGSLTTGAPSPLVSAGSGDFFVARYDATGQHVFSQRVGGAGDDRAYALSARGDTLVVAGTFTSPVDFGGGARAGNAFVLGLSFSDGAYRWVRTYTGSLNVNDIALDLTGGVFVTGSFANTVDFAPALTSAGGNDAFLLHFFP